MKTLPPFAHAQSNERHTFDGSFPAWGISMPALLKGRIEGNVRHVAGKAVQAYPDDIARKQRAIAFARCAFGAANIR